MTNPLLNSLHPSGLGEPKDLSKSKTLMNNSNNNLNNTISNFTKNTSFENNKNLSSNAFQNLGNTIINANNFSKSSNIIFQGSNIPTNTSYNGLANMSMIRSKGNLRSAMDSLDLIPEHDEREIENLVNTNNINNTDLFKNNKIYLKSNYKERYKEESESAQKIDEVDLFTKTILGTNNWGESYPKLGNINKESLENTTYFKPHKKEIEKEIGKSIFNTKLPRARLSTKAIETKNFNRIQKGSVKKENADYGKLFNSTSLSFLKTSDFSKAFTKILARKNN